MVISIKGFSYVCSYYVIVIDCFHWPESTGAISGPSWGASIFMVMAPGNTLLDTDTVAIYFTITPKYDDLLGK